MKIIKSIASTIIAVGGATAILIALWTWTKSQQDISWMTFFVTLFIVTIAFLLLYFLIIEPIKKKNELIEKKIDKNFVWLKECTENIFEAVRELQSRGGNEFLHTLSPKSADGWAIPGSPLKLSESGKILLKKSTVDKIVGENIEDLILKIEELKLSTAYDVQDKSFLVLAEFVLRTSNLEKEIKDFVFNNPVVEKRNIGFRDVIYVGSLLLRDEYLKRHPELESIDSQQKLI